MLLSGRIYFALGPWRFGDFRNIFLLNIGEDQKKSYDFSSGPLAGTQARSQKFAMWGGVGAESPALENFAFFCKTNLILGLF